MSAPSRRPEIRRRRTRAEKVAKLRKRLAAALDGGRKIFGRVKEHAVDGAKATDEAIREHPYQSIGIALGVGVLLGLLLRRRN